MRRSQTHATFGLTSAVYQRNSVFRDPKQEASADMVVVGTGAWDIRISHAIVNGHLAQLQAQLQALLGGAAKLARPGAPLVWMTHPLCGADDGEQRALTDELRRWNRASAAVAKKAGWLVLERGPSSDLEATVDDRYRRNKLYADTLDSMCLGVLRPAGPALSAHLDGLLSALCC